MKRKTGRLLTIILVICLGLTGCKGPLTMPPKARITSGYTAVCSVKTSVTPPDKQEAEEFAFSGNLKRLGSGFWELSITSPDTLAGMKINLSGETVTSSLGELWQESETVDIPDKSPFMIIFRTLDAAAAAVERGETLENAKGTEGWTLTEGGASILFDSDGTPVTMTASGITVSFSEFTPLDTDVTLGSTGK